MRAECARRECPCYTRPAEEVLDAEVPDDCWILPRIAETQERLRSLGRSVVPIDPATIPEPPF